MSKTTQQDVETPEAAAEGTASSAPEQASTDAPAPSRELLEARTLVAGWVSGHIHNGPISRSSECLQQLQAAASPLAEMIVQHIKNQGE